MNKKVLVALAAIALTVVPMILLAQGPPPPPPPQSVPVDGGLSLLVAAGAALGAKKLYDKKK
jgi:peptidoglycan/LPS O-acetylase OafA/YrhL